LAESVEGDFSAEKLTHLVKKESEKIKAESL